MLIKRCKENSFLSLAMCEMKAQDVMEKEMALLFILQLQV